MYFGLFFRCNTETHCMIPVINEMFHVHICPDTPKYLEVIYACVPGKNSDRIA